jgi:biotin carboxyl carrier protein
MAYDISIDGRAVTADILARVPDLRVKVAEAAYDLSFASHSPAEFEIHIGGQVYKGWRYATAEEVHIRLDGRTYVVALPQFGGGHGAGGAHDNEVRADMPGTVVAVHCAEGDAVTSGQKLLTIESMKLQISMVAPRDGTVAKLPVAANTTFERGAVLAALKPL